MATQKVVVGGSSISARQMSEFWRQAAGGSLTSYHMDAFLEHRNPFDIESVVLNWAWVYYRLGITPDMDFSKPSPLLWDVYVVKGVTCNQVVQALRNAGVDVCTYSNDLDSAVPKHDRDPVHGSYAVSFRKTIEADPELKGKTAKMLEEEGVKGITLLERLLLELAYFLVTGKHLDIKNITLCAGSRYSGGDVPGVRWSPDRRGVCVIWYSTDGRYGFLRSRAVVS